MLEVKAVNICKEQEVLIESLSFQVPAGEILTIMGESGSGKSTLLSWLIGAYDPVFSIRGDLYLNDVSIGQMPTQQRRIGILFQDDLLFPHLSIGQNLAFALPADIKNKQKRKALVNATLDEVGLSGFHDRDPMTLSGGQRARISLLRALLARPKALLLDEPFSKLDMTLRQSFREFVYTQVKQQKIPTVLVTHDKDDVPDNGLIVQL